jgi:hypothetical protein
MVDVDKTFLFIGGLHRSGTSLLHRCVSDHSQVSGFSETRAIKDEGQYLQDVYPSEVTFGGPGFFGFHSGSHLDETSPLVNERTAQKLFSEWSEYWELDKPILVEKTPSNLVRGRFLQALFPKARFIMIMRHPIAVSYATKKWTDLFRYLHETTHRAIGQGIPPSRAIPYMTTLNLPIWVLVKHWLVCHKRLKIDKRYIEDILTIRYENFVQNPISTLEKVWKFLGLEPDDPKREIKPEINDKYFERFRKMRSSGSVVDSIYSEYIVSAYEEEVSRFGYSLDV